MVSFYVKQRILELYQSRKNTDQKYMYGPISNILRIEGINLSRKTVRDIIMRFKTSHTLLRKDGSGRPSKATNPEILRKIESYLKSNDEATAVQIKDYLQHFGFQISISTVHRARRFLGWNFQVPAYCQLIRDVNKTKRLHWATENEKATFENVIWTDETSVWLERHKRRCYRKKGETKRLKPRAKHPVKVHVWAGISRRGATKACIFEGSMDSILYVDILERTLKPFINSTYGTNHRFMQDNDPKHTSRRVEHFLNNNNINWWKTPPESPDINPIEMIWHELKEYIRGIKKPKCKQELIDGIREFWKTVTVAKCNRYINHIRKVVPRIIEVKGHASGH